MSSETSEGRSERMPRKRAWAWPRELPAPATVSAEDALEALRVWKDPTAEAEALQRALTTLLVFGLDRCEGVLAAIGRERGETPPETGSTGRAVWLAGLVGRALELLRARAERKDDGEEQASEEGDGETRSEQESGVNKPEPFVRRALARALSDALKKEHRRPQLNQQSVHFVRAGSDDDGERPAADPWDRLAPSREDVEETMRGDPSERLQACWEALLQAAAKEKPRHAEVLRHLWAKAEASGRAERDALVEAFAARNEAQKATVRQWERRARQWVLEELRAWESERPECVELLRLLMSYLRHVPAGGQQVRKTKRTAHGGGMEGEEGA